MPATWNLSDDVTQPEVADEFIYRLYVDGTPIVEHSLDGARRVGNVGDERCRPEMVEAWQSAAMMSEGLSLLPPSYDEAVCHLPVYDSGNRNYADEELQSATGGKLKVD